ncbi:MAG: glycerophosphodiester phosphodiesterase family protein [Sphaerochaetaceae bacterium]
MRIDHDHFLVFGHRGCPKANPENTLPSFAACIKGHVPGAELDVHLTKDGKLVVAHDFSLSRTAHTETVIEETDFADLEKENVGKYQGKHERIPLLAEVFSMGKGKLYFDIEIKDNNLRGKGLEPLLWKTIRAYGMENSVLVSSFNPLSVRRFNKVSKKAVDTGVIYSSEKGIPRVIRGGRCRHIAHATFLKPDWREVRKRESLPVIPWTVDDELAITQMQDIGVSGLISNDPLLVLQVLGKIRNRR